MNDQFDNRNGNDQPIRLAGAVSELEYRRQLKALPRELDPAADLWPGIAARLQAPARRSAAPPSWFRYALAAGLACAALALGSRLLPQAETGSVLAERRTGDAPWVVREAELLKTSMDAALVDSTGISSARLAAHPDRAIGASLRELSSAESELDQALRLNPQSTFLLDRLRHVQQKKARLTLRALAA